MNTSNPEHHYQLALLQEAKGKTEAALTTLRQAIALHPTYLPALLRLGQIYARHDLPFHAFSFLEQAQRLQSDTPVDPLALSRSAWHCGLFTPFQAWIERWGQQIHPPALQQETLRYWLDLLSCQTSSQESWLEQELQALYPQPQENSVLPQHTGTLRHYCLLNQETLQPYFNHTSQICLRLPTVLPTAIPLPEGHPVIGYWGPLRFLSIPTLELWGTLLQQIPSLRLCIFSPELDDPLMKQYLEQIFQSRGISAYRLRLWGSCPSQSAVPFFYEQVHLILAPFPRNAFHSSLQALSLGRAVLSLYHPAWAQRDLTSAGLQKLGFTEGICTDPVSWLNRAQQWLQALPAPETIQHVLQAGHHVV